MAGKVQLLLALQLLVLCAHAADLEVGFCNADGSGFYETQPGGKCTTSGTPTPRDDEPGT